MLNALVSNRLRSSYSLSLFGTPLTGRVGAAWVPISGRVDLHEEDAEGD